MKTSVILSHAAISLENAARLLAESVGNQNAVMLEINAALGLIQTAAEQDAPAPASLATAARAYMEAVREVDARGVPQDSEERAELAEARAEKRDAETDLCAALNAPAPAAAPVSADGVRDQLVAALQRARNHLIMDIDREGRGIRSTDTPEALAEVRAALAAAESAPAAPAPSSAVVDLLKEAAAPGGIGPHEFSRPGGWRDALAGIPVPAAPRPTRDRRH
jgi:hypothetical protein